MSYAVLSVGFERRMYAVEEGDGSMDLLIVKEDGRLTELTISILVSLSFTGTAQNGKLSVDTIGSHLHPGC